MLKESKEINFYDFKPKNNYLAKRETIIKFINYLVHKLKFRSQTFYLTTYITDLIMMRKEDEMRVELVAICSLILTSKFDEIDSLVPDLNFFKSIEWNKIKINFTLDEILECELACLYVLEHRINYYTPYHFMNYFFSNGIVFKDEILKFYNQVNDDNSKDLSAYDRIYDHSKEALFLFIEEEDYLSFSNIDIACACLSIGRSTILENLWDKRLEDIYHIKFEDFFICYDKISSFYQKKKKQNKSSNKGLKLQNKNFMPNLHNLHLLGKENENANIFTRENSRKPNSRHHKITKYSLEPISRHKNILESSRDKKPHYEKNDKHEKINNIENYEKFLDYKSGYKFEKLHNIVINNNFKIQPNCDIPIKRENSVNKLKKPLSNNFNNIIPFTKNDITETSFKAKLNDDHVIDENIITKTKKLLLTKENFDKMSQDLANPKSKNIKIELLSKYPSNNINFSGKASKINYNGNYNKNANSNLTNNNDFTKVLEKNSNISTNLPKYIKSSSKRRELSSHSKEINFNSHFVPKPSINVVPSITSLNNSNDKTTTPHEHFTFNNVLKKIEIDASTKISLKINDDHCQLKEMPIPSLNLYNAKNSYNRLNSGYRDLKYRNELSRKEEIYHSQKNE